MNLKILERKKIKFRISMYKWAYLLVIQNRLWDTACEPHGNQIEGKIIVHIVKTEMKQWIQLQMTLLNRTIREDNRSK